MRRTQDLLAFRAGLLTLALAMFALLSACGTDTAAREPYVRVWTQAAVEQAMQRPRPLPAEDTLLQQEDGCGADTLPAATIPEMDRSMKRALAERSARGTPTRPRTGTAPSL